MVIEIDGRGRNFRDVLRERQKDLGDHTGLRLVHFKRGRLGTLEVGAALDFLSGFPEHWEQTFNIRNVVDKRGTPLTILAVPDNCPSFPGDQKDLPSYGSTFVGKVWLTEDSETPRSFLILTETQDSAEKIMSERAGTLFMKYPKKIDVYRVTPEEFMDEARELIRIGVKLPNMVMRYGDLREYKRQVEEHKANTQ